MGWFELFRGDALGAYPGWPAPVTIISDGAYGLRGFRGDPDGPDALPSWYRPHVEASSPAAGPGATLWFWNTEKPLEFMARLVTVTAPGDVVREAFWGLCSASVAAVTLGRRAFTAETGPAFAVRSAERLARAAGQFPGGSARAAG